MPRPTPKFVTFEIDGREVSAPEGSMLVDAAKYGDVEIPYFCYEPKLGAPVGACRMCLVEIEGMPKLQAACTMTATDGMKVHTSNERASDAQKAVLEFLLINHPLDCPICDNVEGKCLCPLGDACAMPVRSMIKRFREEFDAHVELGSCPLHESSMLSTLYPQPRSLLPLLTVSPA